MPKRYKSPIQLYMYIVRKYPWNNTHRFTLDNRCPNPSPISPNSFKGTLYDNYYERSSKGKTSDPNSIPNDILQILLDIFHDMLFLFLPQCHLQNSIPNS